MKRLPRWSLFATPISLLAWFIAVCLIYGPGQLPLRAGYAVQVFLIELVVVGYTCLVHLVLEKLWEFPIRSRNAERNRRIHEGRCVGCGYSLTGNTSGVCPECGLREDKTLVACEPLSGMLSPKRRWAVTIVTSAVIAFVFLSVII